MYYLTATVSIQIDNAFLYTHFSQALTSLNTHRSSYLPLSPNSIFICLDLFILSWPTGLMTHGPSIWSWIYRYLMSQNEFKSVGISDYNDFLSFKIFKFFQWSCDWLDPISLLPHLSLNMFIGSVLFCFYTGKLSYHKLLSAMTMVHLEDSISWTSYPASDLCILSIASFPIVPMIWESSPGCPISMWTINSNFFPQALTFLA